jgi:phage I-like protein
MASEVHRYVVVGRDDVEDDYEHETLEQAVRQAESTGGAVLRVTYEYSDSELCWTPDGSDRWPPES